MLIDTPRVVDQRLVLVVKIGKHFAVSRLLRPRRVWDNGPQRQPGSQQERANKVERRQSATGRGQEAIQRGS